MYMYILDFSRLQFRAVLFFLFLTFCVINVQTNESVKYSIPTEPTEEKPTLCRNHTTSCSHQIPMHGATQDSCSLVRYEPISEDCKSPNFKGTLDPDEVFGKVILSAYILCDNYPVTAFNVTFTDIKWSRARLRFYESGSEVPDLCREFQVMPEIPSNTSLFFDCLWKLNIDAKAYHFQYIAHPRSDDRAVAHQFVFFVPSVLKLGAPCVPNCIFCNDPINIRKLQLFVSVEVSVLPVLRLHIQTAPEIYNITRYKIELVRTWVDYKWPVMTREETVLPNQTHIYLVHNTDYRPGIYNFSVTPLHDSCIKGECAKSVAPGIPIVASTETPLLIVMVGTVILIPVLIAVYFMWRRTCVPRPTGNEPWQPPKVLLVYNPDYKSHVSDMIRFTEYLKKKCRVEPMFDLFCIPNSNSKDPPTVWYREAFESADFILIFAPPTGPESSEPHEWNPFLNLQIISLNQLRLFTARHNIIYSRLRRFLIGNTQIFTVKLPGCTWDKLYPEAEHFKRLTLPKDIDKLLVCLGVPPLRDNGESLTNALETEITRKPQVWPDPEPFIDIPVKLSPDCLDEIPIEHSELSTMNLMGDENKLSEEASQVKHRANSCDTLLDINSLKL